MVTKDAPQSSISTSAEMAENAALPMVHEVHTAPVKNGPLATRIPENLREGAAAKSPAQWAYERVILYIQNFENQIEPNQEVAMGFTGGEAGVIRIEGLGYFDPDIITFYGTNENGAKTQLVQHVGQLNVMLMALPVLEEREEPNRIGFRLAHDIKS